ncbi:MAG: beta-ketoacyl synthase, partial [Pedobacter sp.]
MEIAGRKVAVVGMAGVFPTCSGIEEFSEKLFANKSLIREWDKITAHGKNIRTKVAGFVTESEMNLETIYSTVSNVYPEAYIDLLKRIPAVNLSTSDIGSIWAMLSTKDAIQMAGWSDEDTTSERTGVVIGSGGCGHEILRAGWNYFFEVGGKSRSMGTHSVDRAMVYREAANVSCLIKNKGVCEAIGSACATGLGNIGHAYRLIKYGMQDRAVAGGVETTSIETVVGFDAMQVLSKGFAPEESSRPFDMRRNGFVCSFGAGIVCLEE